MALDSLPEYNSLSVSYSRSSRWVAVSVSRAQSVARITVHSWNILRSHSHTLIFHTIIPTHSCFHTIIPIHSCFHSLIPIHSCFHSPIPGKSYFEATVTDEGLCRIGWSTSRATHELGKNVQRPKISCLT